MIIVDELKKNKSQQSNCTHTYIICFLEELILLFHFKTSCKRYVIIFHEIFHEIKSNAFSNDIQIEPLHLWMADICVDSPKRSFTRVFTPCFAQFISNSKCSTQIGRFAISWKSWKKTPWTLLFNSNKLIELFSNEKRHICASWASMDIESFKWFTRIWIWLIANFWTKHSNNREAF